MKQDIKWQETFKCKFRVDARVCNSKLVNNVRIKINADVNVKNWLTKESY